MSWRQQMKIKGGRKCWTRRGRHWRQPGEMFTERRQLEERHKTTAVLAMLWIIYDHVTVVFLWFSVIVCSSYHLASRSQMLAGCCFVSSWQMSLGLKHFNYRFYVCYDLFIVSWCSSVALSCVKVVAVTTWMLQWVYQAKVNVMSSIKTITLMFLNHWVTHTMFECLKW